MPVKYKLLISTSDGQYRSYNGVTAIEYKDNFVAFKTSDGYFVHLPWRSVFMFLAKEERDDE